MTRTDISADARRRIALNPPRFRGVLHTWTIPVAAIAAVVAVVLAPGVLPRILVGIYGISLVIMYTCSALFHRIRWTDDGWWRMRQLDQTGIYVVIAGSVTGIAGLALSGGPRVVLLCVVWAVTLLGLAYRWSPLVAPFGMMTALYVMLAALVLPFLGRISDGLGATGTWVVMAGCAVYLVGGLALGARVPDPWPTVFGYHEVWHVLVVIASAMHYIVVVSFAIPAVRASIDSAQSVDVGSGLLVQALG